MGVTKAARAPRIAISRSCRRPETTRHATETAASPTKVSVGPTTPCTWRATSHTTNHVPRPAPPSPPAAGRLRSASGHAPSSMPSPAPPPSNRRVVGDSQPRSTAYHTKNSMPTSTARPPAAARATMGALSGVTDWSGPTCHHGARGCAAKAGPDQGWPGPSPIMGLPDDAATEGLGGMAAVVLGIAVGGRVPPATAGPPRSRSSSPRSRCSSPRSRSSSRSSRSWIAATLVMRCLTSAPSSSWVGAWGGSVAMLRERSNPGRGRRVRRRPA
jgi:hypothetical protein